MKKIYAVIFSVVVLMSSCGGGDSFTVIATVDGLGTQNVRAVYRSEDKVNVVMSMALDGKLQFAGVSEEPVLIDIYTGSRALIGHVIARNGETVEVTYKLNEPGVMTAKGDKMSEQLAEFVVSNADVLNSGNRESVNNAVVNFIDRNRNEAVAQYILMSFFDPSVDTAMADSIISMIIPKSRRSADLLSAFRETLSAGADTLKKFEPVKLYTDGDSITTVAAHGAKGVLLAVYGVSDDEPHDSLLKRLNVLHDSLGARVRVVELSVVDDTAEWKAQTGDIKPRYTRCWMPGGVSAPALKNIAIRRIPWYIAADSTGRVLYSGSMLNDAVTKL